jgi:hypothetical protein
MTNSPKIKAHKASDGTWTATLYISGQWWAQMAGFASSSAARAAIRRKYL